MCVSKFVLGCDLEEFRKYYKALKLPWGELENSIEERTIAEDPTRLIVFKEDDQIIGHAIWHESNTREHRKGDPRDEDDTQLLEKLVGGKKDFVELHELWLKTEHRGKGYGRKFFEFFEEFVANRGHNSTVYYADDPAAIGICRERGYKEAYWARRNWYVFYLLLKPRKHADRGMSTPPIPNPA